MTYKKMARHGNPVKDDRIQWEDKLEFRISN